MTALLFLNSVMLLPYILQPCCLTLPIFGFFNDQSEHLQKIQQQILY